MTYIPSTLEIGSSQNHQVDDNVTGFTLELKGFEGPLHLLLELSRVQKVDLRQISLVDLCEQYLVFIAERLRKFKSK